ncbi:MAG: HAD family phosphatase [Candidatus Bathyarchaeota archaeon]|nr:HAD family phosphatase [Candidatus Bathyarchaeota archaeon]
MFEAVIFDWDGTLADTRKAILVSFHKALHEVHCDVTDEFIERRIGIGAAETFREILRSQKVSFDEQLIKKLVDTKIQAEIDLSNEIQLFPGAFELLQMLQSKVKLGLASMNNKRVIEHLLMSTKTAAFFNTVVTTEEVAVSKPNPAIFLKCALKLGTKPEKCVVVEDSIFGVEAARAAKMGCIAVLTGVYSRNELKAAEPNLIVNSLIEKDKIFEFIFGSVPT